MNHHSAASTNKISSTVCVRQMAGESMGATIDRAVRDYPDDAVVIFPIVEAWATARHRGRASSQV